MGSQEEYETAYRCAAYISALTPITCVLGIVPYIGGAVGVALAMYLTIIASIEVHRIPSQKAWLVFGIIGAILILLTITGEISSRRMVREAGKFQKQMEKTTKEMQKQVEGATKEMQRATEEATKEMQKATEEATKALEELQKQQEKSKEKGD
jgi:predicted PurR-regulated permease PerM